MIRARSISHPNFIYKNEEYFHKNKNKKSTFNKKLKKFIFVKYIKIIPTKIFS